MKILYHHRVGSKDGQIVHIDAIVHALRDLGHEVVVVAPPAIERSGFGANAGFIDTLKRVVPASIYELLEFSYGIPAFWRLWRVYRRERPDVLYERFNLFFLAGVWLKRITHLPMLLEVNGLLSDERSRFAGLANKRLAAWTERSTWRAADYVLPVTDVLAGLVCKRGVDPSRIVVIRNGVSAEFLCDAPDGSRIRGRFGLDGRVVLGFTGFVREWHGLERVIDLIADRGQTLNLHLLIVGDGPVLGDLKERAAQRRVSDRVTFAGLVPREQIIDYIAAFDIALQPQVVAYASPLKLFEYMALGRAILAPSTANIREVLSENEALLFEPDSDTAFQAAVERLCSDPELRKRLGDAARATVVRKGFTWSNNARRIVMLFQNALEKASTQASKVAPTSKEAAGQLGPNHRSDR